MLDSNLRGSKPNFLVISYILRFKYNTPIEPTSDDSSTNILSPIVNIKYPADKAQSSTNVYNGILCYLTKL